MLKDNVQIEEIMKTTFIFCTLITLLTAIGCTSKLEVTSMSGKANKCSNDKSANLSSSPSSCTSTNTTAKLESDVDQKSTSGAFKVTVTFSGSNPSFDLNSVVATNATLSGLVKNDPIYTFIVTPTNSGVVVVKLKDGVEKKSVDEKNATSNAISVTYKPATSSTSTTTSASSDADTAAPTASLSDGSYTSAKTVTLSTATVGATIYYTTDGTTPSASSTVYSSALTLGGSNILKAIAISAAGRSSTVSTFNYNIINRLIPPTKAASDGSTISVVWLTNGNLAVGMPYADVGGVTDAGAVYLYNGTTGELISTITGSSTSDRVGTQIKALTNGNFLVRSSQWDCLSSLGCSGTLADVGAVTFVNGSTGLNGVVSASNSIVGSTANDRVGIGGIYALTNGNYVVATPNWDCSVAQGCSGAITDVGAVTWGNGSTGTAGVISSSNSLIGSTANDDVGLSMMTNGVLVLPNGNYVVASTDWTCQASLGCSGTAASAGAVTWANGTTGISGPITASNSLVGTSSGDYVGGSYIMGLVALTNGNFVIASPYWDCTVARSCASALSDAGAVTWVDGTTGATGAISALNSLVGSTASDKVGYTDGQVFNGILPLSNGNFVILSPNWDCKTTQGCSANVVDAGALTWKSGTSSLSGTITASNSLVGSTASDFVGYDAVALSNGNFVTSTPNWDCKSTLGCSGTIANVGAVTWGNGSTGTTGLVSATNSLVGGTANDNVGGSGNVKALTNGNYVATSPNWDCSATYGCAGSVVNVGAVTWGNGAGGTTGYVTKTNSLIGTTANDAVGTAHALTNGNYVVRSVSWNCAASLGCTGTIASVGAITWGNGTSGTTGEVSASNSLVGSTASDLIGTNLITLTNGNYVVISNNFDCATLSGCASVVSNAGAVTWGSGTGGTVGIITQNNSFIGQSANDQIGNYSPMALSNGNYVFGSSVFDCVVAAGCTSTKADSGALTWGNGSTGSSGFISSSNSLLGDTAGDRFPTYIYAGPNGSYAAACQSWSSAGYSGVGFTLRADGNVPTYGLIPTTN
jgi:hypothetical protein